MKKVLIYTLDYCPYCKKALEFFDKNHIEYENIDVTYNEEEMTQKIALMFGLKNEITYPQIIIDKNNIGGYDNLIELNESNKLKEMLEN